MRPEIYEVKMTQEDWKSLAASEEWRCSGCGQIPPYAEREVYFETKMCGHCAREAEAND